jgi:hypothetical protein
MSEVSLALQAAVLLALRSHAPLSALPLQGRIYDRVPSNAVFPYATFRVPNVVDDSADCVEGSEVNFAIHVWSRTVGWPEAATIAGHVRKALHLVDLPMTDFVMITCTFQEFIRLDDPDGITNHGVASFRALINAV